MRADRLGWFAPGGSFFFELKRTLVAWSRMFLEAVAEGLDVFETRTPRMDAEWRSKKIGNPRQMEGVRPSPVPSSLMDCPLVRIPGSTFMPRRLAFPAHPYPGTAGA